MQRQAHDAALAYQPSAHNCLHAVVFLDADTLVVRNMDEAFRCPGFCASLRHSERLNSGVMVLHPSQALFDDMIRQVDRLPSYTGCAHVRAQSSHPECCCESAAAVAQLDRARGSS